MQLWRLHIRPGGGDAWRSTDFCLERKIIGMGWPVDAQCYDWTTYADAVRARYDGNATNVLKRFALEAAIGDLVWFRSMSGVYYLAEITGDWRYDPTPDYRSVDIVNYRQARIVEVGIADRVPGRIITAFIRGSTFQRVLTAGMLEYAKSIVWPDLKADLVGDLFDFLAPTDIEDLVAIHLQLEGWLIIPGTRRDDTAHYEFVLVHRASGERAIVQVKSGHTPLNAALYDGPVKTFLFAQCGDYGVDGVPGNVRIVTRCKLDELFERHSAVLPEAARRWRDLLRASTLA